MKKIVFLLFLAVFTSCSTDDDKSENLQLEGDWYLTNVYCYCGFDESIDFKDFKLRFDDSKNIVQLENPTEDYYYIAETGEYNYSLEGNILIIEDAEPYTYEIKGSTLILTYIDEPAIADDELVLTYQRN